MRQSAWVGALCLGSMLLAPAARAYDDTQLYSDRDGYPWSVSFYVGPATTKYFGAIFQSANFHPTSVMAGVALDRRLIYLGADIWLAGELQGVQNWFGHHDTGYAVGLGFQINDPFGWRQSSFSIYDGPSWDTDPPHLSIGYNEKVYPAERQRFLNYVGFEYAIRLPHSQHWDGVFRLYHRSGMFGVYSIGDDAGLAVGLGLRYRF